MERQIESPQRKEMRSFRLYFPKPAVPLADGSETEYSPEEIRQLREQFRPTALAWHRSNKVVRRLKLTVAALLGMGMILRENKQVEPAVLASIIACCIVDWMLIPKLERLRCPACVQQMDDRLGEFCPECGHLNTIVKGSWFRFARCSKCELELAFAKRGRSFKIRACTHCGLPLDDKGI